MNNNNDWGAIQPRNGKNALHKYTWLIGNITVTTESKTPTQARRKLERSHGIGTATLRAIDGEPIKMLQRTPEICPTPYPGGTCGCGNFCDTAPATAQEGR